MNMAADSAKNQNASHYEKMTRTAIAPLIVKLSIPTILTMLVTSIYNLADTAFVGRLGNSASGAVGVVFAFMSIIQAFGFVFGQGAGSITARLLGSHENEKANIIASTGLFCSFACGLMISLLAALFLDPLVRLLGSTETILPYAKTYISYIMMAAPFMTSAFTMNQILRFEGHATFAMAGMMTGGILNIIGDPILIFVFHMGIAGAGLATAVSQFISFCILLSMFLRHRSMVRLHPKYITHDIKKISDIVGTGLPSMIRQLLNSVSTMILNGQAGFYGDAAIAGMSIVTRIIHFVFSVALGMGQGFQPVSAFNFGAAKYKRVREAFRVTVMLAEAVMFVTVVLLLVKSGTLIRLFRDDPEVIRIGTRALRCQAVGVLFLPVSMVIEMLLQSTGNKLEASLLSCMRSGILFIPTLLILSKLRGLYGIEEAQAVSFILAVIPSAYMALRFFRKLPQEDKVPEGEKAR